MCGKFWARTSLNNPNNLHLGYGAPGMTPLYQAYSPHTVMFIEERTKLHTSLLQFNIHIHFKLVDNILNPPENKQHNQWSWFVVFHSISHSPSLSLHVLSAYNHDILRSGTDSTRPVCHSVISNDVEEEKCFVTIRAVNPWRTSYNQVCLMGPWCYGWTCL